MATTYLYPSVKHSLLSHYLERLKQFYLPYNVVGQTYVNISDRDFVIKVDIDADGTLHLTPIPIEEASKIAFIPDTPIEQPAGQMPEGLFPGVVAPIKTIPTPFLPLPGNIPSDYLLPYPVISANTHATVAQGVPGSTFPTFEGGQSQIPPVAPGQYYPDPNGGHWVITCVKTRVERSEIQADYSSININQPLTPCLPEWVVSPSDLPASPGGQGVYVAYHQEQMLVSHLWEIQTNWAAPTGMAGTLYQWAGVYSQTYHFARQTYLVPYPLPAEDTTAIVFNTPIHWPDTAWRPYGSLYVFLDIHVAPVYFYNFLTDIPTPEPSFFPPVAPGFPFAPIVGGVGFGGGVPGVVAIPMQLMNTLIGALLMNGDTAGRKHKLT